MTGDLLSSFYRFLSFIISHWQKDLVLLVIFLIFMRGPIWYLLRILLLNRRFTPVEQRLKNEKCVFPLLILPTFSKHSDKQIPQNTVWKQFVLSFTEMIKSYRGKKDKKWLPPFHLAKNTTWAHLSKFISIYKNHIVFFLPPRS